MMRSLWGLCFVHWSQSASKPCQLTVLQTGTQVLEGDLGDGLSGLMQFHVNITKNNMVIIGS